MTSERPTPAEVLRYLAAEEPLQKTRERFPSLREEELRSLLHAVADAARSEEERRLGRRPAQPPPPAHARPVEGGGMHRRLRVHSDGAARGNPGPARARAVLSTPAGAILERLGKYLGAQTNNHAEYMGLIVGLRRAIELGAREVDVFADSELMIRQLEGRYKVKAEHLKPLYEEARALLARFDRVRLAHVRRELNAEADEMSNRAIDERM